MSTMPAIFAASSNTSSERLSERDVPGDCHGRPLHVVARVGTEGPLIEGVSAMPPSQRKPYWIDCLWEKHECWTYDDPALMRIELDGRPIDLLLPPYLPQFEVVTSAE